MSQRAPRRRSFAGRYPMTATAGIGVALLGLAWLLVGALWLVRQWQLGLAVGVFHVLTQVHQSTANA